MIRVAVTTFPDEESAATTIRTLVEEHLAACGNIFSGIRSIYRWKGQVEENPEVIVIFKTSTVRYAKFEARLRDLHPYEIPEIVAFDPIVANEAFQRWVVDSCTP